VADLPGVRVDRWEGLLVDYLKQESIRTIVKGLRSAVDFDYEVPMAQMNRALADVETVFLLTDPRFAHVSSSLVKEVAKLGGDVTPFLSPHIHENLTAKLTGERSVWESPAGIATHPTRFTNHRRNIRHNSHRFTNCCKQASAGLGWLCTGYLRLSTSSSRLSRRRAVCR